MCSILQWWGSYFIRFANFAEFVSQKVISLHWFGNFYWKTIWPNMVIYSDPIQLRTVRTITWWNQHSPVVNRTSFFFQVEIAAWHVLAPNIVCAPVQGATALQCFVKQIPPNLIVLLANVKRNVMRTAASKIVQVEASLCSVTLTAAIRNVLVKPAKSTASQTAESNNVTMATASSCFRLASRITRYAMKTRPHAARRLPAPVCPLRSHFLFFYHKCNW